MGSNLTKSPNGNDAHLRVSACTVTGQKKNQQLGFLPYMLSFLRFYGHGGHLGQCDLDFYIHIGSPFLLMLHINFGFDWLSVSEEKMFKYYHGNNTCRIAYF